MKRFPICLLLLMGVLLLAVSSAWAAPISVDIDKNVNLELGRKDFGAVSIPDDAKICVFSIDRANWKDPAATISVSLSLSVNNGPFNFWLGMTGLGGPTDAKESRTIMRRALPPGVSRRVQGTYVVSGARFISTVSVACS